MESGMLLKFGQKLFYIRHIFYYIFATWGIIRFCKISIFCHARFSKRLFGLIISYKTCRNIIVYFRIRFEIFLGAHIPKVGHFYLLVAKKKSGSISPQQLVKLQ